MDLVEATAREALGVAERALVRGEWQPSAQDIAVVGALAGRLQTLLVPGGAGAVTWRDGLAAAVVALDGLPAGAGAELGAVTAAVRALCAAAAAGGRDELVAAVWAVDMLGALLWAAGSGDSTY